VRALVACLAVLLAVTTAGCPGPTFVVQQYKGPARAQETVATLRVNASDAVQLAVLDDEDIDVPLASDSRLHIELLPGRHSITVRGAAGNLARPVELDAEGGKFYRVVLTPDAPGSPGGAVARVFEIDRGSDKLIRDVTVAK
jgi:hypothetical protein